MLKLTKRQTGAEGTRAKARLHDTAGSGSRISGQRLALTTTLTLLIAAAYFGLHERQRSLHIQQAQVTATAIAVAVQAAMPTQLQPLRERFGLSFVHVPASEFIMGSREDEKYANETPQQVVFVDDFWIGLAEITNAQYQQFADSGGYQDRELWTEDGWEWRVHHQVDGHRCRGIDEINRPTQPVVCVSWFEAVAFARWLARATGLNVHLPTEIQWEKAARGDDGRDFPWGAGPPQEDLANFGYREAAPMPVGSYPAGASPYGALDMAGNVMEWTNTRYQPQPRRPDPELEELSGLYERVVRGGASNDESDSLRTAFRNRQFATDANGRLGFRLAVSP